MNEHERLVLNTSIAALSLNQNRTQTDVVRTVTQFAELVPGPVDTDMVVREIERLLSVFVEGHVRILENNADHIPWLHERSFSPSEWPFWYRYRTWLGQKGWPPTVVDKLDEITNEILGRLEDPKRDGPWDRRGMVVGDVQSGKTANYAGLINKALDCGYKVIIVLTGMHNSLRSQTQLRLDHDVVGYDSQKLRNDGEQTCLGVGTVRRDCIVHCLTDSTESGDFNRKKAHTNFTLGSDPLLLVVKKNATVLEYVLKWLRSYGEYVGGVGTPKVIRHIPLLLMDDEADSASVDSNSSPRDECGNVLEENDPTRINGLIRKILNCFSKRAYVGYTATPFANLFIYPTNNLSQADRFGGDLFPESFIINLPVPSDYCGPVQVFGLKEDDYAPLGPQEPYPIVRVVDDFRHAFPLKHKKGWHVPELPPSLCKAIRVFFLACAARAARGDTKVHNSMLIHVTRFTDVQRQVLELVKAEVQRIRRRLHFGDGEAKSLLKELEELWNEEFVPTTRKMKEMDSSWRLPDVAWDDVQSRLQPVVDAVQMKLVNGSARDSLDYYEHKNGMTVIVIGGDKLSRGLTLEGLSVSYYLRASTMYDTLLQMGRWFGYRKAYLDLCRLYTSSELQDWYRYVTLAYEELKREFNEMVDRGGTPRDYGLKVRTHPAGLQITASNKLRHATTVSVGFDNTLVESYALHRDPEIVRSNFACLEAWIHEIAGEQRNEKGSYLWYPETPARIVELLDGLRFHPDVSWASSGLLKSFIEKQSSAGCLSKWTVALVGNQQGRKVTIGGMPIGVSLRSDISEDPAKYVVVKNHIISPGHEALDLSPEQQRRALAHTNEKRREKNLSAVGTPSGPSIRAHRSPDNGLILIYPMVPCRDYQGLPFIGIAISFPLIQNAVRVQYEVNTVYRRIHGEEDE